jgi:hypothetical protein
MYTTDRRSTLVIDTRDRVVDDSKREERLALMKVPAAVSENVRALR